MIRTITARELFDQLKPTHETALVAGSAANTA
jgi:hypothetical protein